MKLSRPRDRRRGPLDLPMTSMIDVVFLLLIFFVASSQFLPTERNLDPAIAFRRASAEEASDLQPVVIELRPTAGEVVYLLGERTCRDRLDLARVVQSLPSRGQCVFLRVHDGVPFDAAAAAMQICRSSGFSQVLYAPVDAP